MVSSLVERLFFDPPARALDHLHLDVVHGRSSITIRESGAVRPHGARENVRRRDGKACGDECEPEEGGDERAALG